jgi:hypothetical protein
VGDGGEEFSRRSGRENKSKNGEDHEGRFVVNKEGSGDGRWKFLERVKLRERTTMSLEVVWAAPARSGEAKRPG